MADEQYNRTQKERTKATQMKFRTELLDQMSLKYQQSQILYADFLREKKQIDEMVRRIYNEHMEYVVRLLVRGGGRSFAIVLFLLVNYNCNT